MTTTTTKTTTTMNGNVCPDCGAPLAALNGQFVTYACESVWRYASPDACQREGERPADCYEREIAALRVAAASEMTRIAESLEIASTSAEITLSALNNAAQRLRAPSGAAGHA